MFKIVERLLAGDQGVMELIGVMTPDELEKVARALSEVEVEGEKCKFSDGQRGREARAGLVVLLHKVQQRVLSAKK